MGDLMNENEDKIYLNLMAQRRAWQKEAEFWRERHNALLEQIAQRVSPAPAPRRPEKKD